MLDLSNETVAEVESQLHKKTREAHRRMLDIMDCLSNDESYTVDDYWNFMLTIQGLIVEISGMSDRLHRKMRFTEKLPKKSPTQIPIQ